MPRHAPLTLHSQLPLSFKYTHISLPDGTGRRFRICLLQCFPTFGFLLCPCSRFVLCFFFQNYLGSSGTRFDSDVWETILFVVSKLPIDGHRKIKCLACEELRKSLGGDDWHSGQPVLLTVHFLTAHSCPSFSSCFLSGMVLICHQGRRS